MADSKISKLIAFLVSIISKDISNIKYVLHL